MIFQNNMNQDKFNLITGISLDFQFEYEYAYMKYERIVIGNEYMWGITVISHQKGGYVCLLCGIIICSSHSTPLQIRALQIMQCPNIVDRDRVMHWFFFPHRR